MCVRVWCAVPPKPRQIDYYLLIVFRVKRETKSDHLTGLFFLDSKSAYFFANPYMFMNLEKDLRSVARYVRDVPPLELGRLVNSN